MEKSENSKNPDGPGKLRLRPGIIIVILQWILWFLVPIIIPGTAVIGVFGGFLGGLAIVVWWVFFSRAERIDRWAALILMILSLMAASQMVHESIATAMQGLMFPTFSIPVMSLALVIWAYATRNLSKGPRRITMLLTIILASGVWTLLRTEGMSGEARHEFAWRWSATREERFLSNTSDHIKTLPSASEVVDTEAEWPGFRGPNRDGIIRGVQIETDWNESPPVELWRRQIGPGCSSFAVHGTLLFTQEQRGEEEIVTCYNLTSGELVWIHRDSARFWDSHAGAGPRGTPAVSKGYVYSFGATGILNALEEGRGAIGWSRNAASDTDTGIPDWGFSSSPLVVDSTVFVAVAGNLVAYDAVTGEPKWYGPSGSSGYSSPQLLNIDGVAQIVLMSDAGALGFSPEDGTLLWKYSWPQEDRILQPAVTADGNVLLNTGGENGMICVSIDLGPEGWNIEERWTSIQLKSFFNDIVVHKGHAYGFTGPSLACISLEDGNRQWRGGRYGGQLLLLADQDLIVVLTEKGELALVKADPEKLSELARIPAIEGKTWNHPVMVGDLLFVRNTREMAAFRIPLAGS